jgi:xanthine dehydrogenase accessory factor
MNFWHAASELQNSGVSFVSVTLLETRGSAPQDVGAKCLVTSRGLYFGTVGGGKVEAAAIERAKEMLALATKSVPTQAPFQVCWNLQRDIKMTCGGEVTFLFEHFPSRAWKIALFGAGHVGQALSRVLMRLSCHLTVIDERLEWLEKCQAHTKLNTTPEMAMANFDEQTFFLSLTKGHQSDVPVLLEIAKNYPHAPYIGVIGSAAKANVIRKDLSELGVKSEFIERLHIPVGLPIGNNSPEEIAISIAAQLLQVRGTFSAFPEQHT